LAQEIAASEQRAEKLKKDIVILIQKEQELKRVKLMLVRCKKTMELGVKITDASGNKLIKEDSVVSLAGTASASADSLMAECKNLLCGAS
ncbi:MAG: hypothetical protein HYT65_03695, partial [Candidatus Yanofskybacteria bacterium]|nr:hypothetical protein [Candidatus Yanofskybacteria bacterium]